MPKLILGICGEMASGKGTIATYVIEEHKGSAHRFSTMLRDILDRVHIEQSREHMQKISEVLRKAFGEDVMAQSMYHDVMEDTHDVVVVDGIRRLPDIKYLETIPHFKLVYVDADIETRYHRVTKRRENTDDATKTFDEFKREHEADSELQIKDLKNYADYVLNNNGTFQELYDQVKQIVDENVK